MSSNVKPLIALGLTAVGTVLVANFQVSEPQVLTAAAPTDSSTTSTSAGATATPAPAKTATSGTTGTTATTSGSSSVTSGSAAKTSSAAYADGTYAGTPVNEPWGAFDVRATISNGQLTAVTIVSSPSDRHSNSINSQAVPLLTQEALTAQSADIDMISGATWTSRSYITSLQAALDDAAAAAASTQQQSAT